MKAHRVPVEDEVSAASGLDNADYGVLFELGAPNALRRSAEQWARVVFEDASWPMRAFLRFGWRFGLGFGLGALGSPDHVLGHRIVSAEPEKLVLELRSPMFSARNVFLVDSERVRWATFVRYERPALAFLWSVAAPIHHLTAPRLLDRAAGVSRSALSRSARYFNAAVVPLLNSGVLGKRMTNISYTGRRSGKTFTTPVAFQREGDDVTIGVVAPDKKKWWRNFTGDGGQISLTLDGTERTGHATAHRDERGRVQVKVHLDP